MFYYLFDLQDNFLNHIINLSYDTDSLYNDDIFYPIHYNNLDDIQNNNFINYIFDNNINIINIIIFTIIVNL